MKEINHCLTLPIHAQLMINIASVHRWLAGRLAVVAVALERYPGFVPGPILQQSIAQSQSQSQSQRAHSTLSLPNPGHFNPEK